MAIASATTALAGHYSAGWAVVAGLAGGFAFLMIVYMGLAVGMTRMNFLKMLGTMMAPDTSNSAVYSIGFMIHMMLSAVFGLAHAGLLHVLAVTSVGNGAAWDLLIGTFHGIGIVMALPMMLLLMHPLVRRGQMEKPGVALTGFGSMTPLGSLMAHAAFGLVAGTIYTAAILR